MGVFAIKGSKIDENKIGKVFTPRPPIITLEFREK